MFLSQMSIMHDIYSGNIIIRRYIPYQIVESGHYHVRTTLLVAELLTAEALPLMEVGYQCEGAVVESMFLGPKK